MYRLGVDVGGTNTNCAILDITQLDSPSRGVLVSSKTPTTVDITSGIAAVVQDVLEKSKVAKKDVVSVTIGTTHFVNAVVEADERRLSKVAVVALVGVFSPLDHAGIHEEKCRELMLNHNPALDIVCSHTIGGVGLLERENATILNASILAVANRSIDGFKKAMKRLELNCNLYSTQNDGTLTNAHEAAKLPIESFASGPTNSMTGAAFLAGLDKQRDADGEPAQILVVDIGGTTSDVCALLPSGFPRQAPNFVEVGGVRTAFSMPDVLSVGLGGGSRVSTDEKGNVSVGPESVGHYLTSEALVFGGNTVTATDVVAAAGKANIGNVGSVTGISPDIVGGARKCIKDILQKAIDGMKVSNAPVTILLVGGGSIVYMDELEGVANCIIPPHYDSANAVGAAIAKASGESDVIEILDGKDETRVLENVKGAAIRDAIKKGADPKDVKIVEVEKFPLQYITNKATRIRVKAVGNLGSRGPEMGLLGGIELSDSDLGNDKEEANRTPKPTETTKSLTKPSLDIDVLAYRPNVRDEVWYVSEVDLEFIACGTGILGTGGGGSSYIAYLMSLDALRKGGKESMRIIAPDSLKDEDIVAFGSWYGAPSVSSERLPSGNEIPSAIDAVNKIMGLKDFQALVSMEIGGGNGLSTFPTSVHYNKPTVDADMMGRAYPSAEHCLPYVYGHPIAPCALADSKGNVSVVMSAESNTKLEKMLRATCIELGLSTCTVSRPLPGSVIKNFTIPNTISQSWYLGRAVHIARKSKTDFTTAIFEVLPGRVLFTGKIIDVTRDISRGYTTGRCLLAPLSASETETSAETEPRHLIIPFQNEFLYAAHTNPTGSPDSESIITTVPDLISILGEDGEALGSQDLRYGLKVVVIGMPAHPLRTADERGLRVGGPEYFGLDVRWEGMGGYAMPRSVIEEFG